MTTIIEFELTIRQSLASMMVNKNVSQQKEKQEFTMHYDE